MSTEIYFGIPTDAELIKALTRGISTAISAKSVEALGVAACWSFAAPGEVRRCPPFFKRGNHAPPAATTTAALHRRGKTNSAENTAEYERQGGASDHRVLLRDANIAASTMPA